MDCQRIEERLTRYALGDLPAAERADVAAHLQDCAVCQTSLRDIRPTLDLLRDVLADRSEAPERLSAARRARILDAAARREPARVRWFLVPHRALAMAAGLTVVCGFVWLAVRSLHPLPSAESEAPVGRVKTERAQPAPWRTDFLSDAKTAKADACLEAPAPVVAGGPAGTASAAAPVPAEPSGKAAGLRLDEGGAAGQPPESAHTRVAPRPLPVPPAASVPETASPAAPTLAPTPALVRSAPAAPAVTPPPAKDMDAAEVSDNEAAKRAWGDGRKDAPRDRDGTPDLGLVADKVNRTVVRDPSARSETETKKKASEPAGYRYKGALEQPAPSAAVPPAEPKLEAVEAPEPGPVSGRTMARELARPGETREVQWATAAPTGTVAPGVATDEVSTVARAKMPSSTTAVPRLLGWSAGAESDAEKRREEQTAENEWVRDRASARAYETEGMALRKEANGAHAPRAELGAGAPLKVGGELAMASEGAVGVAGGSVHGVKAAKPDGANVVAAERPEEATRERGKSHLERGRRRDAASPPAESALVLADAEAQDPKADPLAKASLDVLADSYAYARSCLLQKRLPPADTVRTEDFVNALTSVYAPPADRPAAVYVEAGPSPFAGGMTLVKLGVRAKRGGRDLEIQPSFDPARVARWRALGYESRPPKPSGSREWVTMLFEVEPKASGGPLGTARVKVRPAPSAAVEEIVVPLTAEVGKRFETMSAGFRLAACAAEFAEILGRSPSAAGSRLEDVARALRPVARERGQDPHAAELLSLVETAASLFSPAP